MTPLHDVVRSPAVANILAQHYESAEEAARQPTGALLAIHKVGAAAVAQLRAWQALQEPPIPVPQEVGMVAHGLAALVVGLQRAERVRILAERIYKDLVVIDAERNLPVDFAGLRATAQQAAETFYPAPAPPEETLDAVFVDDVEPAEEEGA